MPHVAFVTSPGQAWFMQELGETIRYELELLDIPCSVHTDHFPEPRLGLVYALLAPRQFVELEGEDALPDEAILRRTAFICADPPWEELDDDSVALLRRAGAVFDIDIRSVLKLHRHGIPARTLRPGHCALRDRFDPAAKRPIDVMFLGTGSARRLRLLHDAAPVLARHNCLLQLSGADDRNARGSASFIAADKYDLLAQTKVVVNLHGAGHPHLEWLRMLEAMHSGAVFVTEHATGLTPFVAGEHLLVSGDRSLPYVIEAVLRDPELAARLRSAAHERLAAWLPFALSIGVLRAAFVELVGRPVPPDARVGRAIRAGPDPEEPRQPSAVELEPGARMLGRELLAARADLVGVRRELARLRSELETGTARDQTFWLQTPAWRARRAPRVTVITVLSGPAEWLADQLDSIESSWIRDLELIVVAGSEGASPARTAARWLGDHPRIPSRLVFRHADFGVGVARNVALEAARAPSCLILGPGEELYPRCLEVLLGTLESVDAELVYPIVEVGGAVEAHLAAGGEPLAAYLGWDPSRLRLGPTDLSPYLIRTGVLRSVGGFSDDPRLAGYEDYDLLCEIASRGWRGQLVPQILARRRASSLTEVPSAANFVRTAPIELLAERHPAVLGGLAPQRAAALSRRHLQSPAVNLAPAP